MHHYRTAVLISFLLAGCGSDTAGPLSEAPRLAAYKSSAASVSTSTYSEPGVRRNYTITLSGASATMLNKLTGTQRVLPAGTSMVEFTDSSVALDTSGEIGKAYRLYQAAFNRVPDAGGISFWYTALQSGYALPAVAAAFMDSAEFRAMYGSDPSNRELLAKFYENILGRTPDASGLDFWVGVLDSKAATRAEVLAEISESAENRSRVAAAIANGIDFYPTARSTAMQALYSPNDAFGGASLDTCRWFDWSANAPQLQHEGKLALRTSATEAVSLPQIQSQYSVSGDFSVEVNIEADAAFDKAIPSGAQQYAALRLSIDERNLIQLAVAREGAQLLVKPLIQRAGQFSNPAGMALKAARARLRIASSGGRISFYVNEGSAWVALGSEATIGDGEYFVALAAATIGHVNAFTANFSDYTVSGTHSYRPYVPDSVAVRQPRLLGGVDESIAYDILLGQAFWGTLDPLDILKANGMNAMRTTVTTVSNATLRTTPVTGWKGLSWQPDFWQSAEVTQEVLKRVQYRGMESVLAFFLSDKAANAGAQDAPAAWQGLTVDATAALVKAHTRALSLQYKQQGINIKMYEIGNEIDTGILNFRPGERIARGSDGATIDDLEYMRTKVWSVQAKLLKAAIEGIKEIDPAARVTLHTSYGTLTPSDRFIKAFYKAMKDEGVPYEVAGLSLPYSDLSWRVHEYSTVCWFQRLQETSDYLARLGKKTMISEASYPNDPAGSRATPMRDFPFTVEGQRAWMREHLRYTNNNPNMEGFFYFYPAWYPGRSRGEAGILILDSFSLFKTDRGAQPALAEFAFPTP